MMMLLDWGPWADVSDLEATYAYLVVATSISLTAKSGGPGDRLSCDQGATSAVIARTAATM
jgi:hypothetical protein